MWGRVSGKHASACLVPQGTHTLCNHYQSVLCLLFLRITVVEILFNYCIVGNPELHCLTCISDQMPLLTAVPVKSSLGRESLMQRPRETQPNLMGCLTTWDLMISNLRAQNSQASWKEALVCVLFITNNVLLFYIAMLVWNGTATCPQKHFCAVKCNICHAKQDCLLEAKRLLFRKAVTEGE